MSNWVSTVLPDKAAVAQTPILKTDAAKAAVSWLSRPLPGLLARR